jgi:uncharacterized protein YeaO (DUF488 family)
MSLPSLSLTTARVHDVLDDGGPESGQYRVLVDRLWPRGIKKDRLTYDAWDKDVTPSADLRQAFHQEEIEYEEFAERYRRELEGSEAPGRLVASARDAGADALVLLSAVQDTEHSHLPTLLDVLGTVIEESAKEGGS